MNGEYLGDGVYIRDDGYHLVLMTGNHIHPDNIIYLDDQVVDALLDYIKRRNETDEEH